MKRVGLLGGTFDPPHIGHLTVAEDVRDALELDEVWLLPACIPPHKQDHAVSSAETRLEMVRAAVANVPGLDVCDVEIRRGGVSYTADTLEELTRLHPDYAFYLVMGVDQLEELSSWRRPQRILELAEVVVMARDGVGPEDLASVDGPADHVTTVPVTRVDVSSTEIRGSIRGGGAWKKDVPVEVHEIIERDRLYRHGNAPPDP